MQVTVKAQSVFVDLSYPEDLTFTYNERDKVTLKAINKVVLPEALPDVGVDTENIIMVESAPSGEEMKHWYNGVITFDEAPVISSTTNLLKVLVYSNNDDIQILIKGEDGGPIYHWRRGLIPNQWNTVAMNLSDPALSGKKIKSIEFAPVSNDVQAYVFPYWDKPTDFQGEKIVPVYQNLLDIADTYTFTTNSWIENPYQMEVVSLDAELKEGLPSDVNVDNIFKLTSRAMEEGEGWTWWWVYTWTFNEGHSIKIEKDKPVLSFFVKSPNDKFVMVLKNNVGESEWYHSNNEYTVVPNEWTEIKLDFTGRAGTGVELRYIEMATYTPNTSVYICPMWYEREEDITSIESPQLSSEKAPYLNGDRIIVEEESEIRLYNVNGQLVGRNYGTSIPAIKGLNIVVVNGKGYKLLNK
jgi:hypothetical protein